jgi:hypothetical protein
VLCLGLLYHVSKPMTLLEWIARINTDLLAIDTNLSTRLGSLLEIHHDDLDDPRNACDRELVTFPTRDAMRDMVRQFGYETVVLRPNFDSYEGSEDFRDGRRRGFLCARRTDLAAVMDLAEPDPEPQPVAPLRLADHPARALLGALAEKVRRRLTRLLPASEQQVSGTPR